MTRPRRQRWFVYLADCRDGTLYCGITTDLKRRLAQHRDGTGAKYTRSRGGAIALRHWEPAKNRSEALKREAAIKKLKRVEKLALKRR